MLIMILILFAAGGRTHFSTCRHLMLHYGMLLPI